MYVHMYACCMYVRIFIYVCMTSMYMYICMFVYMYVYVCMYVCMYFSYVCICVFESSCVFPTHIPNKNIALLSQVYIGLFAWVI